MRSQTLPPQKPVIFKFIFSDSFLTVQQTITYSIIMANNQNQIRICRQYKSNWESNDHNKRTI